MTESMRTAFDALTDGQRAVLHLTRQGRTYAQVAEELDVPADLISTWAWQAMQALNSARKAVPRPPSEV